MCSTLLLGIGPHQHLFCLPHREALSIALHYQFFCRIHTLHRVANPFSKLINVRQRKFYCQMAQKNAKISAIEKCHWNWKKNCMMQNSVTQFNRILHQSWPFKKKWPAVPKTTWFGPWTHSMACILEQLKITSSKCLQQFSLVVHDRQQQCIQLSPVGWAINNVSELLNSDKIKR